METKHEPVFDRQIWGEPVRKLPSGLVPSRQVINGSLIQLEPLNPVDHAAQLYNASHDCAESLKIWEYLPFGPWPSQDAFQNWLGGCAGSFDHIWYALRHKTSGQVRGMACYLDVQPSQGVIEIGGIWFAPDMQRTRAATEALFLLLDYAMGDLAYRRMQWRCNALNQKSRNAALRLGFKFEGIFYNHMMFKGMNRDTAWYSILDSDWRAVREIITAWLHDDNFDTDNVAQSSLGERMGHRIIAERN